MSLHAAHFREALFSMPGCVRHLCICGAAAEGLSRLAPEDCTVHAMSRPELLRSQDSESAEGIFLALLPSERSEIHAWFAACASIETPFPMLFLLAEDAAEGEKLAAAFQPDYLPYAFRELRSGAVLVTLTRNDYDPLAHGAACREQEDFAAAYHVACYIPESALDDSARAALEALRLEWLLDWAVHAKLAPDLVLTRAQGHAFEAISRDPENGRAVAAIAAVWRYCGDPDRAEALLKHRAGMLSSPETWVPDDAAPPRIEVPPEASPPSDLRILFVTHPRPHYGLDVLYDGLYRLLGPEGIVEYPFKATLHGAAPQEHIHYPCHFHHPAREYGLAEICALLENGHFHAVLWGDCEEGVDAASVQQLAAHSAHLPLWIVDGVDECVNLRGVVEKRLGRISQGYFKREMVRTIDYGPDAWPLPFAYVHGLDAPQLAGRAGLFWAGHRRFGMRRLYIEPIEAWLGEKLDAQYDQEAYRQAMLSALVGLNLCGAGFDTVRYWELPAHGVVLLTENVPLVIPENFRDGVDALVFQTPSEAIERLAWALAHPVQAAEMGEAGRRRFQAHHSTVARARQVLQQVQKVLT